MVLQLSFCTVLEIPHFFCELNQMIQLASSDTFLNNVVMYSGAVLLAGGSLIGILYSYSITSHIHSWVLFLLWLHSFILSGVISPLISSSILGTY